MSTAGRLVELPYAQSFCTVNRLADKVCGADVAMGMAIANYKPEEDVHKDDALDTNDPTNNMSECVSPRDVLRYLQVVPESAWFFHAGRCKPEQREKMGITEQELAKLRYKTSNEEVIPMQVKEINKRKLPVPDAVKEYTKENFLPPRQESFFEAGCTLM